MIRKFKLPYALVAFCGLFCLLGCSDPIGEEMSAVTSSEQRSTKTEARNVATRFYYYRGEKLFLTPTFEKVFVVYRDISSFSSEKRSDAIFSGSVLSAETPSGGGVPNAIESGLGWAVVPTTSLQKLSSNDIVYRTSTLKDSSGEEYGLGYTVYVKLKTPRDETFLRNLAKTYGLTVVRQNEFMPLWFVLSCLYAPGDRDALDYANLFAETKRFEASEPDLFPLRSMLNTTLDDPLYHFQWGLNNTGQRNGTLGVDISYENARLITAGSKDIVVAVIDEGVDLTHPDLNLFSRSYDAVSRTSPCKIYGSHGTACAGIIGARCSNSLGISGIAPECPILPISINFSDRVGIYEAISNAFNFAVEQGVAVISNSWGGSGSAGMSILEDAIRRSLNTGRNGLGCIVVFATGNEDLAEISYPARAISEVLAVGAMDPNGNRKRPMAFDNIDWGSNYGEGLDLIAPGVFIPTTDIQGYRGYDPSDYFLEFNGTSSACPHVAGVAALVLSKYPFLNRSEVNEILCKSAVKIPAYDFSRQDKYGDWNNEVGYGRLDAYSALLTASTYNDEGVVSFQNKQVYSDVSVSGGRIVSDHVKVFSNGYLTFKYDRELTIDAPFDIEYGGQVSIL